MEKRGSVVIHRTLLPGCDWLRVRNKQMWMEREYDYFALSSTR